MRQDPAARITLRRNWGDYHLLRLDSPNIAAEAKPGQFLMVRIGETLDPLLRRPLSIHAKEGGAVEIFFQIAGRGTARLARMKEGEALDILGPLGRGFDLAPDVRGKTAFLVGGGRGIAPLYFLSRELRARGAKVKILYGGRSLRDLPVRERFLRDGTDIACATDDGSFGRPGFVTDLLEAEIASAAPDLLFVCGPDPMMRTAAGIARARGIPAQISLESVMGCGFGACWGCVKRIARGDGGRWRKICEDGPVFLADEILWDGDA
jgi:dihydroorotate dehydrogenase electron transfer subunit